MTVLDFANAFRRDEAKDAMVAANARECKRAEAALYGYVVMPHHVHLLVRLPEQLNGPQFMRVFKRQSSGSVAKLLTAAELHQFDQQRGLNGNTFWQRSFRSISITEEQMFWQKMDYIHHNPVKAAYVERPEEYRWSSAALVMSGLLSEESGLPYEAVIESLGARPSGS